MCGDTQACEGTIESLSWALTFYMELIKVGLPKSQKLNIHICFSELENKMVNCFGWLWGT